MMIEQVKKWWQSKTILAVLTMILTPILAHFGLPSTDTDTAAAVDAIVALVSAVAGVVAVYGRMTARHRIV